MYRKSTIAEFVTKVETDETFPANLPDLPLCAEYLEWVAQGNTPDPAPSTFSQKAALLRIRDARKPVLDALTGIAGRAQRAGNTTVAVEADALSQALLDVTKATTVVAAFMAQDDEAVDHAVLAYYRAQAAAASPAVQSAFNEIAT